MAITKKTMITADGINALANASALGTSIKPKYFKFTNQDLELDPTLSASDIVGWRTQNITAYLPIKDDTTNFVCTVQAPEATDFARFVGIYLDDGTLFMVGKPEFPIPPGVIQRFNIPLRYANTQSDISFEYISSVELEQDYESLHTIVTMGNQLLKNTLEIKRLKIQGVK